MRNNKFVLPIIILLLIIFVPSAIYGLVNHLNTVKEGGNPDHLPKYNNTLYFYDETDNLIGTYPCISDVCLSSQSSHNDTYFNYVSGTENPLKVFNDVSGNKYVFIQDDNVVKLYNLTKNVKIIDYLSIKNYNYLFDNNSIIVQSTSGYYGLFSLSNINYLISPKYEFLGTNKLDANGKLKSDKFAVYEHYTWFIIDINDNVLSTKSTYPIYDYNNDIIVYNENNNYIIRDYEGNIKSYKVFSKVTILDSSIVAMEESGNIFIYNSDLSEIVKTFYYEDVSYNIENNVLYITQNNSVLESYNL